MVDHRSKPKTVIKAANDNDPLVEVMNLPEKPPITAEEMGILISHLGDIITELAANDNGEDGE